MPAALSGPRDFLCRRTLPLKLIEADRLADAVSALRAKEHTVEPCGADLPLWRVDDEEQELSAEQLLSLALRFGLAEGPGRAQ
jgi:hypothetical protein